MLVAMLFNFAAQYALPVLSAENDSYIAVEGDRISDLSLADGEKILLDAVCETEEITRYSWQIRYSADPELWVNISGANGKTLAVSCAVVASLADEDGVAYVRCVMNGYEEHVTNTLAVYLVGDVSYLEEEEFAYSNGASDTEDASDTTDAADTVYVIEEDEIPAEDTTAASENTTIVSEDTTAATENTTIVSEDTTAATEDITSAPAEPAADTTADTTEAETTTAETTTAETTTAETTTAETTGAVPTADETTTAETTTAETTTAETTTATTTDSYRTHSIVINYLFDNNAIAFEPYGASIAHGTPFKEIIESPPVIGYEPFRRVGEDYIKALTVELDIPSVTEDITINVIYEPALVNFSVHHHLQNLHNDDYSLVYDYITTGQALTGSTIPLGLAFTEEQLPGFKALSYERLTVAADGSTVVEIRYDRNYYLVDFDMNGGYGTEPVYTRFGDSVGANVPIRHGYVFDGWELISYGGYAPTEAQQNEFALAEGTTVTVPAANLRYRARWINTQTTYTMVFWQENENDGGYTYWGHIDGLGALSGTLVSGRDIVSQVDGIDDEQYFTFNEVKTDKNVLVEGDGSTVVNVYYTRNYYKITVRATGKCTIPEGHSHGSDCYDYICGLEHIHTDACDPQFICTEQVHEEHTADCLICTETEHTHSPECSCPLLEHTHVKGCWQWVGTAQSSAPSGAPSNPVDGQVYRRGNRYIYIKGRWYRYNGTANSGTVVDTNCGYEEEHTHSDACACKIVEHTHGLNCYKDVIHVHGESCYVYNCGEQEHVHSDSCLRLKCGITLNHSHSYTCNNSGSTNVVKEIYRKYGQSIKDIWPIVDDNGVTYDGGERWKPSDSSFYDQVLVFISEMPPDNFTLTLDKATHSPYTMNYYLEALEGEELPADAVVVTYEDRKYVLDNVIKAQYNYVTRAEDFFDISGFTQYESDPAFSGNQISISNSGNRIVDFYYNRITDHYLNFNNNGTVLEDKEQHGIPYGEKLESYYFEPDYPTNLEPNAYAFEGWYTSPGCFDGTEVDWSTLRMPEGDLLLYAKWAPVKHTVRVWLDDTLTEQIGSTQTVDHGAFAHAPHETVSNGNYVFQGWFYTDIVNGEEVVKAFNFSGIPVLDDMDIYAKWGSHVSVDYKVNYLLYGTDEPIADPTVGSAIAGNNKTFEAKAGADLYEGYRAGYYPLVNSHTITMSVDGTHEFTFYYVYVPSMPYMVRYVNAETGDRILPDKVVTDNTLSVITETFVRVDKMMPDAYQKRLVLSASNVDEDGDGIFDDNVITFYYSSDEVHAYYKVVHYLHAIGTDGYREYRSVETVGTIGSTYTVDAVELTGFYFNGAKTKVDGIVTPTDTSSISATLGAEGMLIELYYDRLEYDYTVIYVNGETGASIIPSKEGSGLFGAQVTEYAEDLRHAGYTLQNDGTKTINISANEEHNVIEFIYLETTVSIKYHVVGLPGCGTLSRSSENVKAVSGNPQGSMPTVANGHLFVGWFTDQDCTVPADPSMVDPDTMELVPVKPAGEVWGSNTEFFAKFIPKETKLTVICTGSDPRDADQAFIFRLQGKDGTETADIDLTFTVIGNGSAVIAGLPLGEYTVTELVEWSWRYGCVQNDQSITLTVDVDGNKLVFANERINEGWLDGNAAVKNLFE